MYKLMIKFNKEREMYFNEQQMDSCSNTGTITAL